MWSRWTGLVWFSRKMTSSVWQRHPNPARHPFNALHWMAEHPERPAALVGHALDQLVEAERARRDPALRLAARNDAERTYSPVPHTGRLHRLRSGPRVDLHCRPPRGPSMPATASIIFAIASLATSIILAMAARLSGVRSAERSAKALRRPRRASWPKARAGCRPARARSSSPRKYAGGTPKKCARASTVLDGRVVPLALPQHPDVVGRDRLIAALGDAGGHFVQRVGLAPARVDRGERCSSFSANVRPFGPVSLTGGSAGATRFHPSSIPVEIGRPRLNCRPERSLYSRHQPPSWTGDEMGTWP